MKELTTTLRWIFGGIFILTGIILLFFTPFAGVIFFLLGLFLLPYTMNLFERTQTVPRYLKYTAPFFLFGLGILVSSFEMQAIAKKKNHEELIKKSKSIEFAEEIILKADDSTFSSYKRGEFKTSFIDDEELNKEFIKLLKANLGKRDSLLLEKERQRVRDSFSEIALQEEKIKIRRQKQIEEQFSKWDGSHRKLEEFVKENMKNPDSYEHVETTYRDMGEFLLVQTKYRGTNSFNAIVPETTTAKVSLEGELLEILQ